MELQAEPEDMNAANTLLLLSLHETQPSLCLHRSVRHYGRRCAHIGCTLSSGRSSAYCCDDHKTCAAATATIQVAFQYGDSFVNEIDRERVCCTLLYNRRRGLQVGIPTLQERFVGDVFSKIPWEQPHLFPTDLETRDFLFFMNPPSQYKSMCIGTSIKLKWHSRHRLGLQLEGCEDQDTVFFTPFFLDLESKFRDANPQLYQRCKIWHLLLFQSGEHSLYCLTCSKTGGAVEPTIIREQRNKKVPPPPSTSTQSPAQGPPPNQSQNPSADKEKGKGKGRDLGKGNTKPPMIGYLREWVNGTKFQISTIFFPEVCGSIFDSHHGFHVEYGTDRDVDLGFHLDDSELTSNASLSKQFEENFARIGELFFRGTRCKKHDVTHTDTKPEEISDDSHTPDQAVLRLGSRATTTSGHGASMIPCSVLKREAIISQGILKLVRSMLQRNESKAEADSCCQKKGVY